MDYCQFLVVVYCDLNVYITYGILRFMDFFNLLIKSYLQIV